jgi:hypothetical protein
MTAKEIYEAWLSGQHGILTPQNVMVIQQEVQRLNSLIKNCPADFISGIMQEVEAFENILETL